jgi:hypothetical protein
MMEERQVQKDALFYEFSLERHVPDKHLLRAIDRFVDLSGVRESGPSPRRIGATGLRRKRTPQRIALIPVIVAPAMEGPRPPVQPVAAAAVHS